MPTWTAQLRAKDIAVQPIGLRHWRTTKGARTVDYWPTTKRWRDLGLGVQGVGVRSLIAHYGRDA